MRCTRPITLYFNEKGEKVNKNTFDSNSPIYAKDVGCGKCLACRINKRREWTLRLCHEEVFSSSAFFITLTYDEDHVPFDTNGNMAVSVRDIQDFMKRLRYRVEKDAGIDGVRFFLNSEYGELGRPHYHAILFNVPPELMMKDSRIIRRGRSVCYTSPWLLSIWGNGSVEIGIASKERAGYCAKYFVDRKEVDEILVPNFSLMSRKPGIGFAYQDQIADKVRYYGLHACLNSCGTYVGMPRYYRNKIYSDAERRAQFIKTLDEIPDDQYQIMLDNADIVEQNRKRALTWKGKKQKL